MSHNSISHVRRGEKRIMTLRNECEILYDDGAYGWMDENSKMHGNHCHCFPELDVA